MGPNICKGVDESRRKKKSFQSHNYIALISKSSKPKTLLDFRPISLCNLVYKIISTTISNKIKRILVEKMSFNQFDFLVDRQIHDVIGITQEVIHSIKEKITKTMILKMDLNKVFVRVNLPFLKLVLL